MLATALATPEGGRQDNEIICLGDKLTLACVIDFQCKSSGKVNPAKENPAAATAADGVHEVVKKEASKLHFLSNTPGPIIQAHWGVVQ